MRRPRLRPLLLALGFVVGLAVGLVTCAHGADATPLPLSTYASLRASMERLPWKPPPGSYRLSPVPPQPGVGMDVVVDATGCDTPYGRMTWYDPPGLFKRPGTPIFGLVWDSLTAGRFINGSDEGPFTAAAL